MLRLTTLGAVGLGHAGDGAASSPVLAQPKRLALLAYLATARPGALVFRDTLLPLLWPDMDDLRARRALRQTLYHLRRELGDEVIVTGGDSGVGVDPDRLWCDAVALERAVAEDRPEVALELYAGEFMAGFHTPGGSAYERWLDRTRDRLHRKAVAAAATLVEQTESDGRLEQAIEHARRLVGLVPSDERATRTLIRLLATAGDRAGAVAAYHALADHLDRALELEPDPDTRALLAAVRSGALTARDPDAAVSPATAPGGPAAESARGPAAEVAGHSPTRSSPGRPERDHALAVLPFVSLSGTTSEQRLADGLTELLITELTRATAVPVISRTSVQGRRSPDATLADIARKLDVDRVVEGTVQEADTRLRVTVQLISTPPERHIWADSFERARDPSFGAQTALAEDMARAIARALGSSPAPADSASVEARDAYFRGRCQFVRMTPPGFIEAARHFQEAIRADPGFARAHAALAHAQAVLARSGRVAPTDAYPQARRRAQRALELEPALPEAHLVLGICATLLDWDWPRAERHMERGLRRGPDLPDAWWAYSNLLCITGRHSDARRAARRARELDPVAPTVWLNEVLILVAAGRAAEADTVAEQLARFHPESSASAFALGMVRDAAGDHTEAADHFARAFDRGGSAHSTAARAENLARAGRTDEARHLLAELRAADGYIPPTGIARIHAALGEADEAFHWLDRAVDVRDDWLLYMDGWPRFEGIRDDPRFGTLRQRIGLPAPAG